MILVRDTAWWRAGTRRVHAVGVSGMGLGPLAIYLAGLGHRVTGEDASLAEPMRGQLERAEVGVGESGHLPAETELVVVSSAVRETHATVAAARAAGVPVARRGEVLAEVTHDRRLVAVGGSHGKTTTTALLVAALRAAEFPVGYILGGLWGRDDWPPASASPSEWVVAEVDESDGTIAGFAPAITVLVNLDWDHADYYTSREQLTDTFAALVARTREVVLRHAGCALSVQAAMTPSLARGVTFGAFGDYTARLAEARPADLTVRLGGRFGDREVMARVQGAFNVHNLTAALAAADLMGARPGPTALAAFPGVRRRQGILRDDARRLVMEDYAHHPAEITALLAARREAHPGRRQVVVFQPHRYSRTATFRGELATALAPADALYLLDVYGAGEEPQRGGDTADLVAALERVQPDAEVVCYPNQPGKVLAALHAAVRTGDCVLWVGAGDIDAWARQWLAGQADEPDWEALAAELRGRLGDGSEVRRDEPMAGKTTLRVGGPARLYVEPADATALATTLGWAGEHALPVFPLGRGSNLLVPDAGVAGVVVSLRQPGWESFEPLTDGRVRVGAGLRLKRLCGLAAKAGLTGFEFLEGIPGNVGGALRMNAGAMGGWMFDVVESVDVMDDAGETRTLRREDMHVDYRHCAELEQAWAVGAILRPGAAGAADDIARQIDVYRDKRQKSQPKESSAGCIFKNPPDDAAGRLIEACGLKGTRVGDAEVSTVHANFIINRGAATADEVIALVRTVRAEVQRQAGVTLEPEVLLYGARWEDVL